jgi:hypothetical protein
MRRSRNRYGQGRHGAVGIVLLLVVAVLVVVLIVIFRPILNRPAGPTTVASSTRNRSEIASCTLNRNVISNALATWFETHPGEPPAPTTLRYLLSGKSCAQGGVYYSSADGKRLYCTVHDPPPDDLRTTLIEIATPTPTPTPP